MSNEAYSSAQLKPADQQMWYFGGNQQGPSPATNPVRQAIGNAVEWAGTYLTPWKKEGYLSELIAGGPTNRTGQVRAADNIGDPNYGPQEFIGPPVNKDVGTNKPTNNNNGGNKDNSGNGDNGENKKSDYDLYKEKNPYSDITPNWNPADFENELNNIYNQALDFANQQKGFAEQSRAGNVSDIENQFGVSQGTLDTSKAQTLGGLSENELSAKQRQEQSLDSIRRLYNEMMLGYQQRFGGASSAGEAAKALAGQEMQRQMGTTRQSTSDALRQIETQKVQVEQNYKNSLLDLQNKKNTAVNEANRNFQSAILSIDNDLKTAANEKSLAKMNLLKEYKTDLFNIKQQEAAWKANIETMKYQADLQNESYRKQLQASASAGSSAIDTQRQSSTVDPTTGLYVNNSYNPTSNQLYTGQMSKDDQYKNFLQGAVSLTPSALFKDLYQ